MSHCGFQDQSGQRHAVVETVQSPYLRLLRYMAITCTGLIVYASLHPFSGWHDKGVSPVAWLYEPWPRYWSIIDVCFDIFAYALLGFLITLVQREQGRRVLAILAGIVLPTLLSFAMESTQTWLPSRVSSILDWSCNSLGGFLGMVLAFCGGRHFVISLIKWRLRFFDTGFRADWGIILLALWLFAQLSFDTLPFSTGNLHHFLNLPNTANYGATGHSSFVMATVACNLVVLGLLLGSLLTGHLLRSGLITAIVLILAILIRILSLIILAPKADMLGWLDYDIIEGLLVGGIILAIALRLPADYRVILAAIALVIGTALINFAPESPYIAATRVLWQQGNFVNFNGMTRMVASCWPFLTVSYLLLLSRDTAK